MADFYQAKERSDRTPQEPTLESLGLDLCRCASDSPDPGPHHDEDCPLYQLPDYGVFGPDE